MKAYYYVDTRRREILIAPNLFYAQYKRGSLDVNVNPDKVLRRTRRFNPQTQSVQRGLVEIIDFPDEDAKEIIEFCNHGMEEAVVDKIFILYAEILKNHRRKE